MSGHWYNDTTTNFHITKGETMKTKIDKIAGQLAKEHLSFETLEERKMDSLDFHEVSVWSVKDLIRAAYQAGRDSK